MYSDVLQAFGKNIDTSMLKRSHLFQMHTSYKDLISIYVDS